MSFDSALKWYSGKKRENAAVALVMLQASVDNGAWLPKHAVKVKAALNKCNVAAKWANENCINAYNHHAYMAMMYGSWQYLPRIEFPDAFTQEQILRNSVVKQFRDDMAPIAVAIAKLDATRPKPVFTTMGASPTVSKTLSDIGLHAESHVWVCPMEFVTRVDEKGVTHFDVILKWPTNTVHGTSRFTEPYRLPRSSTYEPPKPGIRNACHACGHTIRKRDNWVPLLVEDAHGVPHSLWVGRDCARAIFGIDVKGDLTIAE